MTAYTAATFALLAVMAYLVVRPFLMQRSGAAGGADRQQDVPPVEPSAAESPAIVQEAPLAAATVEASRPVGVIRHSQRPVPDHDILATIEAEVAERKRQLTLPHCRDCGEPADSGDRFCRHCGAALTGDRP
jgi:hypothetical protein